jgi:hypothetical protein
MGGGAEGRREESGLVSLRPGSSPGYRAAFTGEALLSFRKESKIRRRSRCRTKRFNQTLVVLADIADTLVPVREEPAISTNTNEYE